jgi:hypothetical protein
MTTYKCELCNYKTDRTFDMKKHKASKKHIKNMEDVTQNLSPAFSNKNDEKSKDDTELFQCQYCGSEFKYSYNKTKHEKSACKKKAGSTDDVVKLLLENNKEKTKQIDFLMELLKTNSETANKSISTTSYIIKHFDKAPPMKKMDNKKAMKLLEYNVPKNHTSGEMIVYSYESKTLTSYLGNIIVDEYKKTKPEDQSVWNSDSVRLSFIVRQALETGDNEWVTDKSGIKLTALIISPMLDCVKKILKKYLDEKREEVEQDDCSNTTALEHMASAGNIIVSINRKELHTNVLKHISPQFNLDLNKLKLLNI